MNGINQLLRLKALRLPVKAPTESCRGAAAGTRDRLVQVLGAESRSNGHGEYLCFTTWHPEPRSFDADLQTLQLIAPGSPDAVADPEQWLFLDTETTGLAGGTGTYAFLVGLAWWERGGLAVEQLFMRDHSEEASLLAALQERMSTRRVLVTFNGKSFDWPLLETRFRMSRSMEACTPVAHLDFLYPARSLWRLRLGSVRLAEIERHILGWKRTHDVQSELIPQIYLDFVRGGPCEPLVPVFRHNEMDLRSLAALSRTIISLIGGQAQSDDALDLFGLSRFYERRRDTRARQTYEQCMAGALPDAVDRAARQSLGRLTKREGDLTRACEVWQSAVGDSREGYEAYEQLAIYHEHQARNPKQAIKVVFAALDELSRSSATTSLNHDSHLRIKARFEHRVARLARKLKTDSLFAPDID